MQIEFDSIDIGNRGDASVNNLSIDFGTDNESIEIINTIPDDTLTSAISVSEIVSIYDQYELLENIDDSTISSYTMDSVTLDDLDSFIDSSVLDDYFTMRLRNHNIDKILEE